jgi:hypothetical protein
VNVAEVGVVVRLCDDDVAVWGSAKTPDLQRFEFVPSFFKRRVNLSSIINPHNMSTSMLRLMGFLSK